LVDVRARSLDGRNAALALHARSHIVVVNSDHGLVLGYIPQLNAM